MKKNALRFRIPAARRTLAALACAPLLALTACGGGGGDGDGGSGGTPQGSLVITSANAMPVAADALNNATNINAPRAGGSFILSSRIEPGAAPGSPILRAVRAATGLAMKGAAPGAVMSAAVGGTLPCSQGSVTVSGNLADPNGESFAAGDSITLTSSGCTEVIDNIPMTMAGSVVLTVTGGGFSPGGSFPQHVVLTMQASAFSVTLAGETSTVSGDMNLDVTETGPDATNVVVTGNTLANQVTTAAGTRSYTLRGYRQELAMAGATTSYRVTADVETSNPRIGNAAVTYHLTTPVALVISGVGDVSAGTLRVDGNASALLLAATATNVFQLQVDADGDGTFESSRAATLSELRAAL